MTEGPIIIRAAPETTPLVWPVTVIRLTLFHAIFRQTVGRHGRSEWPAVPFCRGVARGIPGPARIRGRPLSCRPILLLLK